MSAALAIRKIPETKLGVSEPPPSWFGNRENERGNGKWTNANWLKSRFHFSFAEYSNPRNLNFGVLRVMNDDLVQPDRGFGEHPHRDVEICTYVVEGKLTHKDSMGTAETLGRGAIQFMTAGQVTTLGGIIPCRRLSVTHSVPSSPTGRDALGAQPGQGRAAALHPNVDHHPPTRPASQGTPHSTRVPHSCAANLLTSLPVLHQYGSFVGDAEARRGRFAHLVADVAATDAASLSAPIRINQVPPSLSLSTG